MKISRRRLVDFVKTLHQKACRTCSTIIFPHSTNQIIDLWRCRRQILNSLLFHKENTLSWYCNTWMLKLSPKKTKIIIFQRCKRKCDSSFYICNEKNLVQNYTYLGISSTGNFTLSQDHLQQKVLHLLFSLGRKTDFKSPKPSLACKICDSMISPILTYSSEVWGTLNFVSRISNPGTILQSKKLICNSVLGSA